MSPLLSNSVYNYTKLQIETASQRRLICMLHEQCVVQLRQALQTNDTLRRQLLDKVQNILVILQRSLKLNDATSKSLFHLYDYCYCKLERDTAPDISNTMNILDILRQTFNQLLKHPC